MGLVSEFREFAVKGNAIDMAVGIIVGAGFGKIVTSLVNDVIMPPVGMLLGGADFSNLKVVFRPEKMELVTAKVLESEVALRYGAFINTILDFVIVAACVFLLVKGINMLRRAGEKTKA